MSFVPVYQTHHVLPSTHVRYGEGHGRGGSSLLWNRCRRTGFVCFGEARQDCTCVLGAGKASCQHVDAAKED